MVPVAQLAERRPVEANVAGSFPVRHPKKQGCFALCPDQRLRLMKKPGSFDLKIIFGFSQSQDLE